MKEVTLRATLERLYQAPERLKQRNQDPIQYPRRYRDPLDQEVVAFLAASLAFGRISLFQGVVERLLNHLGPRPARRLRSSGSIRLPAGLGYRMIRTRDLEHWLEALRGLLREHGTLRGWFQQVGLGKRPLREVLEELSQELTRRMGGQATSLTRGMRQLSPSPHHGGPCKRWNLFLRWMVRPDDGVDLGLWDWVAPSTLVIPLDTHVARIGFRLGLLYSPHPSWRAAERLTKALARLCPEDPLRYDFVLCHLGVRGACPSQPHPFHCRGCRLNACCQWWQGQSIHRPVYGAPTTRTMVS